MNRTTTLPINVFERVLRDGRARLYTSTPKATKISFKNRLTALRARVRDGTLKNPRLIRIALVSQSFQIEVESERAITITIERTQNDTNSKTSKSSDLVVNPLDPQGVPPQV